jgi:uncharacterized membrane protein YozB (DUF420 family)
MFFDFSDLPTLNALLNTTSAILLLYGYRLIRSGNREGHKRTMIAAFVVSCLFLISYLVYHYHHGSQPFQGRGWIRPVYFTILFTHTVLAMVNLPLVLLTLGRGLKKRYELHKKIARWTLPIWLYVSISGVMIYLLLYQFTMPTL